MKSVVWGAGLLLLVSVIGGVWMVYHAEHSQQTIQHKDKQVMQWV